MAEKLNLKGKKTLILRNTGHEHILIPRDINQFTMQVVNK